MNPTTSWTLTKELLESHPNPIFLETGTFKGGGVALALECGFPEIYSIEISDSMHRESSERHKDAIDHGKVHLIYGDSGKVFKPTIMGIDKRCTIWLDAHWKHTSLFHELHALQEHPIKDHVILIDDIRLFRPDGQRGWGRAVNLDYVKTLLKEINPDYRIETADSRRYKEDILVAFVES